MMLNDWEWSRVFNKSCGQSACWSIENKVGTTLTSETAEVSEEKQPVKNISPSQ